VNLTFAPVYHNQENKDRKFRIGKFRELNIYGAEIIDSTGEASAEEALLGGTDILLMGLTEDEFLLKDTDKEAICSLIDKLVKELPKDRLISFKQTNYKGEISDKQIQPRCETMDEGKYTQFLQSPAVNIPNDITVVVNSDYYLASNYYLRAMSVPTEKRTPEFSQKLEQIKSLTIKKLKAIPEFVFVYNQSLGERFPTIGPNGAAWAFTMEDLAKNILEKNSQTDLQYKIINSKEFFENVDNMHRLGITDIIFNPGFDFAFGIKVNDLTSKNNPEVFTNSEIHALAIRFLQNKNIKLENCQNTANILWNILSQKLSEGLFLVPMLFDGDKPNTQLSDNKLHYTKAAYDMAKDNAPNFYGITNFDTTPSEPGGNFKYLTLKSSAPNKQEQTWLPIFTDITELHSMVGTNTRVCVATFAEIGKIITEFDGMCINPKGINMRLEPQSAAQAQTATEEKADEPTNEANPETEPKAETVTPEPVNADKSQENQKKKSVLGKLFGKKE